ncbi:MAG TPA: oligosaccharide flippase family protein [Bryobacteraceae bacterium]|nr:oligosaccharide flippase family protein [Bryobacteraceae bacterium]
MKLKAKVMKGGLHLSIGQVAMQISSFVRNIILARLISPADFGIAAIFGLSLTMIEVLSNVATEMLLIQAPDGDDPRLQGTAQLIRAARGAGNSLIIFVLAGPLAKLFGVPQATWAFRCLALVPLSRWLFHLDMSRLQRHMRFAPSAISDAGANVFATLITVPLAFWLRDYSAMLWAMVIQVAGSTIASHLLAERRYRWVWDREHWKRMVSFGWPLMINGILLLGIFEGDRLVIGSSQRLFPRSGFSLTDLGVYSATFSLTMAPTLFIANISASLFLPLLSTVQGIAAQFQRRYVACLEAVCLAAAVISILFITAGGKLVTLIYGSRYAAASLVIGWLAAMWALRIVRVAPTLAAMALGDTKNTMISNFARSLALIGMAVAAASGAGLVWVAISGFGGEALALIASVWRLHSTNAISPRLCVKPVTVVALGMGLSAFATRVLDGGLAVTALTWLGCTVIVVATMLALFQGLREDISTLLFKSRGGEQSGNLDAQEELRGIV